MQQSYYNLQLISVLTEVPPSILIGLTVYLYTTTTANHQVVSVELLPWLRSRAIIPFNTNFARVIRLGHVYRTKNQRGD